MQKYLSSTQLEPLTHEHGYFRVQDTWRGFSLKNVQKELRIVWIWFDVRLKAKILKNIRKFFHQKSWPHSSSIYKCFQGVWGIMRQESAWKSGKILEIDILPQMSWKIVVVEVEWSHRYFFKKIEVVSFPTTCLR